MPRPELKQFGELEAEDFERHPVWIGCHTADYGKPWYKDTDEETFRPYTGKLPADASEGMLLVRAVIELRDGSRYPGFVTPAIGEPGDRYGETAAFLGTQQPHIFVGEQQFGFWGGMVGISSQKQQELYSALRRTPDAIFPLRFGADPALATGLTTGHVEGFYRRTTEGIQTAIAEPVDESEATEGAGATTFYQMSAKAWNGIPQPGGHLNFLMRYKKVVYSGVCTRCGMYDSLADPFRFGKSGRKSLAGFCNAQWTEYDMFFVRPEIAEELQRLESPASLSDPHWTIAAGRNFPTECKCCLRIPFRVRRSPGCPL